jgi:hypothetical protein
MLFFFPAGVVSLLPVGQAHIAELVVTQTGYVVAAFNLLNEHVAVGTTLPILEVLLEILVTGSIVLRKPALFAESALAALTIVGFSGEIDEALTVFLGAEPEVGVTHGLLPEDVPLVPFF